MTERQIENIIWHIETNRKVLGDERTLDDVLKSLKNNSAEETCYKLDKNKLITEMAKNTELKLCSPYYAKLLNSLSFNEFKEEDMVEAIVILCENIKQSNETIIKYMEKHGSLIERLPHIYISSIKLL